MAVIGLPHILAPAQSLLLVVLGKRIRIECRDPALQQLLTANFGMMAAPDDGGPADLHYRIERNDLSSAISLIAPIRRTLHAEEARDVLFLLDADITIALQRRRADLFFLHSAAIDSQGRACLLAAESGRGKSTTTWALLQHGFGYLSDELSPVDIDSLRVFPFPRALRLKRMPPASYPLPDEAIDLGQRFKIATPSMTSGIAQEPRPIGAVVLLEYRPDLPASTLRVLGAAEASARLYVTALNALAHPNRGLDAVVRIAENVRCYAVSSVDLPATCALIQEAAENAFA
jgi:hypothetical protein